MKTRRLADPHLAPDEWLQEAPRFDGAWWPAWQQWLAERSGGRAKPPPMGAPRQGLKALCDAPGQYVLQR